MGRLDPRRTLAALAVSVAVAACGTASPTTAPGGPTPAPSTTPSPPQTVPPTTPADDGAAWVPAGALQLGRASTHAVLLADGRVLVVGSDNVCTPGGAWDESVAAEVFDPAVGSWAPTGSLNAPRTDFVAVALPDGIALVVGGLTSADPADGVFGAYSSAKLYDPATGTWSATGLMGTARTEPVAALLPDGTVLVAGGAYVDDRGGRSLASAEIYDPETGAWSRTGDMGAARRGARAVTLADGRVLVVGDTYEGNSLASAEIYDPASGEWTPAGTLAQRRDDFALVALPDGGALVAGGTFFSEDAIVATATTERFDPMTSTWSASGTMLTPAASRSAVVLGHGRVLVAGGISAGTTPDSPGPVERPAIVDAETYDPATGTWTATTPLPEPREGGVFVTLADRTVLLVGGDRGYVGEPAIPWCPEPLADALRYVPANVASFPPGTRPAAATVARSDVPRAAAKPADAAKAAASIAAFGIDLYQRLLADKELGLARKNVVLSPTSIALALGMARAGASGETATEMDDVLHTSGWDALGAGLNALDQALASRNATWKDDERTERSTTLRIANGAFGQQGWAIEEEFLDRVAATFGSGIRLIDYQADPEAARQLINAWVKKRTAGRIPQLLGPPDVTVDTRLYLVNAVYLKAEWDKWFREATPRAFTLLNGSRVKVPTMETWRGAWDMAPYARGAGWRATEVRFQHPRGGSPLAMVLIRPDDLARFEKSLTAKRLAAVVGSLDAERSRWERPLDCGGTGGEGGCYPYDLRLLMPKFSIETRATLNDTLEAAGMPLAFDLGSADFTGIHVPEDPLDRAYISKVVHQANIDVDERGVEAAAATAVGMATGGGPSPLKRITLRLDRPFFFVLRDVETGAILFMGRVVDPTQK
jgi:serine protease inhibitor